MLVPPATFGARGTSLINSLRNLGLMTGLQGCFDVADINCYPGSGQVLKDLSGQGNDMVNGLAGGADTTQDMAFVGVAGRMSAAEYFERNASTGVASVSMAVPTWMQAVHKDNGKFSFCQWTKTPSGTYGMGSIQDNIVPAAGTGSGPGFSFGVSNGTLATLGYPIFSVTSDAANTSAGFFAGTAVVPNSGNWSFSGCAIDEQAGTAVLQIDTTVYSGAIAYSSPSAGAAGNILAMGPSGAATHQKACWAFWDRSIGAVGLEAARLATRGRFS